MKKGRQPRSQGFSLACVASVSVGLGSKESQRNGIFGVLPARKIEGGRGGKRPWYQQEPILHPEILKFESGKIKMAEKLSSRLGYAFNR